MRCFQFAKIAADKGHEVTVFLVDDAVYFTNLSLSERIKAPTGDDLMTYWKFLVDKGAAMLVCKPCAATRTHFRRRAAAGPYDRHGGDAHRAGGGVEGVYFLTRPRRRAQ